MSHRHPKIMEKKHETMTIYVIFRSLLDRFHCWTIGFCKWILRAEPSLEFVAKKDRDECVAPPPAVGNCTLRSRENMSLLMIMICLSNRCCAAEITQKLLKVKLRSRSLSCFLSLCGLVCVMLHESKPLCVCHTRAISRARRTRKRRGTHGFHPIFTYIFSEYVGRLPYCLSVCHTYKRTMEGRHQ